MATGGNSKNANCYLGARRLLASSFYAMTAFCRQIHATSMNMPAKCVSQKNSRARSSTLHVICGLADFMLYTPFAPWPSYSQEEADEVASVLLSNRVNYWTGEHGRAFETEFARFADADYAIAVANGTLALELALHAIRLHEGDEVIVTSRTFIASISSIVNAGARPVFADVCKNSQNITAESIAPLVNSKTKAIVCVHLAGWPCDMDPVMELAKQHDLFVIEDCAQAHGAKYKGRALGAIGDIGAWSFCQDKIMTTGGEGGMVSTNNRKLWERMWAFKDHGKSWDAVYNKQHPNGFRWLHESFGSNFRMTEMQAVIGRIQLKKMPVWTSRRQQNANLIDQAARKFHALRVAERPEYIEHACYKHYVFVEPENLADGWSRDRIIEEIIARGVPCFQGSCSEVYLEKAFEGTEFRQVERLPVARRLGETSLMFLVHPTLSEEEMKKRETVSVLEAVIEKASQ